MNSISIGSLPAPVEMNCSCYSFALHVPVIIDGNLKWQCTQCGRIR